MTLYNAFGSSPPAGATQPTDNAYISCGCRFHVTSSGMSATAIRFYSLGSLPNLTRVGALYSSDDVGGVDNLGQANFPIDTTAGWQQVSITPIALTINVDYYIVVYFPTDGVSARYSAVANLHDSAVVSGPITIVAHSATTPNSTYNYSAGGPSAPRNHFSTTWFGLDIEVDDGVAAPDARAVGAYVAPPAAVTRAATW